MALPSIRPTRGGGGLQKGPRAPLAAAHPPHHTPGLQGEPSHSTYEGLQRAFRLAAPLGEPSALPSPLRPWADRPQVPAKCRPDG